MKIFCLNLSTKTHFFKNLRWQKVAPFHVQYPSIWHFIFLSLLGGDLLKPKLRDFPRWQKVSSVHVEYPSIWHFIFLILLGGDLLKTKLRDFQISKKSEIFENVLHKFGYNNAFWKKSEMTESFVFPCRMSQYITFYFSDPFWGNT